MVTPEHTLTLPQLVGSREDAQVLADELGDVRGSKVILDARELEFATESAANRFVEAFLVYGGAASVEVRGADRAFTKDLDDSARANSIPDGKLLLPATK